MKRKSWNVRVNKQVAMAMPFLEEVKEVTSDEMNAFDERESILPKKKGEHTRGFLSAFDLACLIVASRERDPGSLIKGDNMFKFSSPNQPIPESIMREIYPDVAPGNYDLFGSLLLRISSRLKIPSDKLIYMRIRKGYEVVIELPEKETGYRGGPAFGEEPPLYGG